MFRGQDKKKSSVMQGFREGAFQAECTDPKRGRHCAPGTERPLSPGGHILSCLSTGHEAGLPFMVKTRCTSLTFYQVERVEFK